jgi:hypothetical protein
LRGPKVRDPSYLLPFLVLALLLYIASVLHLVIPGNFAIVTDVLSVSVICAKAKLSTCNLLKISFLLLKAECRSALVFVMSEIFVNIIDFFINIVLVRKKFSKAFVI